MGGVDDSKESIQWILYIAVPFTPLVLEFCRFYDHLRTKNARTAMTQLTKGLIMILLIISVFAIFAKLTDTRRLALGSGLIIVFFVLLIRDRITHYKLKHSIRTREQRENVIIAGSEAEVSRLLTELTPEITDGWNVVEQFDIEQRQVEELFPLLKQHAVGRVIFAARETGFETVARAVEACELQGVEAWIGASFIRSQIARPVFDSIGDKPMLVLRSTPELSWELLCKGIIDRVGATIIILISSPLWLVAAIGIRIASPEAPVFFSQMRAGRYGKPFRMWKFRTMVPDAEELLDRVKQEQGNEMSGPVFKLGSDPRIFPFGSLLRKFSIDELPQLLNVLAGQMSLVGPRPLPLYEVEAFTEMAHRRRLSVKPGVTCEWQVGGRNRITKFEDWVAMDLRYIDNWSLWLDLKILLMTIPAVLFGHGAK
jgi:exopolysaccharide biosynthesis polyprenyl glycosylphosphotransferase